MKTKSILLAALALGLTSNALAQGTTAFTYQGRLNGSGGPVTGSYDLKFAVYDAVASGNAVSSVLTNTATTVTNGLFTLTLDFGSGVFTGSARWLDLAVRTNGNGAFTALAPRQPLTPAPYALFAPTAGVAATAATASSVANNGVSGPAIASGQVVKSLNGLHDAVTLAPGANVSLVTNGNALTISAAGGGTNGGWATTGNAGTTPTVHFLGTTDGQPLVVKANNVGINTNNPQAALHVNGTVVATRFAGDGSGLTNVPAAPFTLKNLAVTNNGAHAVGVAVAGNFAYVANGYDGLRVYDISDPAHPVNVGLDTDFGWDATAVTISGHTAFVASETLYAVDISSPANPVTVGKGSGSNYTCGVAVSDTTAFLASESDGLFIFNVADPMNPVNLSHINGQTFGVAVAGNFAYLANGADGLRIYNMANPAAPMNISHTNNGGLAWGVTVSGSFAYLANNDDGLRIYNISNPTNPVNVGHIYEAGNACGVAVSGRYAFVANYGDGLRVYDVSDPAHPSAVSAAPLSDGGFAVAVAVSGYYAYAANQIGGLATYFAAPLATVPGVVGATGFMGDGSALTNLNASQLIGQLAPPILSGLWQATGNAGTTPDKNFLGTTDEQPLELRAHDKRGLRIEPSGDVVIDPEDSNRGSLTPGLVFGVGSGEGIASARTPGGDRFGLDFFTGNISRMSIDNAGSVHIGSEGSRAKLDVHVDTVLNDHDITFRFGNGLDGIGYYNGGKPFGPTRPVGPVLFGQWGGFLGTTDQGQEVSLSWDADHVQVTKNLDVSGNLTATNTPGVNWDQTDYNAAYDLVSDEANDLVVAACTNARPAPGFFVIMASVSVEVAAQFFEITLYDSTNPHSLPIYLTSTEASFKSFFDYDTSFDTTLTLTWVVPISAAAAPQSFSLVAHSENGQNWVEGRNLTVMYFPRQNN